MLFTQSSSYKEQGREFLLSGRGLGMMFTVFLSARSPSTGIGGPREGDALENGLQAWAGCSSPEESTEFSSPSQGQNWADQRVQLGHGATP